MSEKILYIVMRTDLPSMNAGKAMAQASHASNQFVSHYGARDDVKEWQKQANGFGTVLVLAGDIVQVQCVVNEARNASLIAQTVIDPSYPYRANLELADLIPISLDTIPRVRGDDQYTLWRSETTCSFAFGTKEELQPVLGYLKLHP